jgi:hypothetical protein
MPHSPAATAIPRTVTRRLQDVLAAQGRDDVFPELALTLYAFVAALHRDLPPDDGHVCFLSREGQPLMRLYELYRPDQSGPRPRYLEVSRRSTLLPSLGPLATEQFHTLFRQYRAISLFEFLASLGLEDHLQSIAAMLGTTEDALRVRLPDLPTDPLFAQLVGCPDFQRLYEDERCDRRAAFLAYVQRLHDGNLPRVLSVVDVGWKGTIQDNLHALCRAAETPIEEVVGRYVGLVAEGHVAATNGKRGLLFSCVDGVTPFFRTFNENRSLLEIVLAADHGSVTNYRFDADGEAQPLRGTFDEESMVREVVLPVQRRLIARFREVCDLLRPTALPATALLPLAARFHARMVFRPRRTELDWFSAVFHVENYGVFERSEFVHRSPTRSLRDRLAFVAQLRNRATWPDLGFWPYKTIRDRGGALAASIYGRVRQQQG